MSIFYRMEIVEDKNEGGFVASYPAMPGCILFFRCNFSSLIVNFNLTQSIFYSRQSIIAMIVYKFMVYHIGIIANVKNGENT